MSPLIDAIGERLPPDLRLHILTTEHWSLLSTRALTWSEAFSRATMFLSAVTGSVVALALVAGVTGFDGGFATFALLLLPVLLFAGVGTFRRLIEINREDVRWVVGMNRLRHAYLEAAPELRPYFVTAWADDEAGIMTTFGARPGSGSFAHEFVTTPGLIAVIDGVLAGVLAALLGLQIGVGTAISIVLAVGAGVLTIGLLAWIQYRLVVRPRGLEPRFPDRQPDPRDQAAVPTQGFTGRARGVSSLQRHGPPRWPGRPGVDRCHRRRPEPKPHQRPPGSAGAGAR